MEELIERIAAVLTAAGLSAEVTPKDGIIRRLTGVRYAVGLRKAQCVSGAAYDYFGRRTLSGGGQVEVFGRRMKAEATVTVFASSAADMLQSVSDAVAALSAGVAGAVLREITVGETEYRSREDGFRCEIGLKYDAVLYAESGENEPEFLEFRLEGEVE